MSADTQPRLGTLLISAAEISSRVKTLAAEVDQAYSDLGEAVVAMVILKGSFIFAADLARSLGHPVQFDFIAARSYPGASTESSGHVQLVKEHVSDISGRHVLIVEDIVDTGRTTWFLIDFLRAKNPRSLKVCALLDKPSRRIKDVHCDFVGFSIPDAFVVGYGLDYDERYRELDGIYVMEA